jgi:CRISPR/Cas system CSM-associated protein Csm3 (group 7 of RAMP superfamily)
MAEGFQRLQRLVSVPVTYTTYGYLAVHTGLGDGVRDNLVIREGGDETRPIIPGSTLKGVVRSLVEAILTQAHLNTICVPFAVSVPQGRIQSCSRPPFCDVCQLFGNTRQRSRVTFHDAKPTQPSEELSTYTRHHVVIERDTGAQASRLLMSVEAVPGNELVFTAPITLINPDPWMVGAVIETLPLLPYSGVGARKSRGYGDLRVAVGLPSFVVRPADETEGPQEYRDRCVQAWEAKRQGVTVTIPPTPEEPAAHVSGT